MNCFMIYKRDKKHAILASNPMINFRDISKIVADQWREETLEVKDHYKNLAKIEMKNHQEKYPDYRFPSSKGKHGKKKAKGMAESLVLEKKTSTVGRPKKEVKVTDDKNEKLQEYIAKLKNISGITFQDSQEKKKEQGFTIPDGSNAVYKHRVLPPLIQNRAFMPKGENNTGYILPRPPPNVVTLPLARSATIAVNPPVLPLPNSIGIESLMTLGGQKEKGLLETCLQSRDLASDVKQEDFTNVKIEDFRNNIREVSVQPIQRVATPSTPLHTSYSTPMTQKSLMATPESSPNNIMEGNVSQFKSFRPMAISEISDSFSSDRSSATIQGNPSYFLNEGLNHAEMSLNHQCKSFLNLLEVDDATNPAKRARIRGPYPLQCEICSSTFVRRHDLKRHLLLHSGLGPYRCSCGRHFSRQDFFARHLQSCRSKMILSPPESPALYVDESNAPTQLT